MGKGMLVKRHTSEFTEEGILLNETDENYFLEENKESFPFTYLGMYGKTSLMRVPVFSKTSYELLFSRMKHFLYYGNRIVKQCGSRHQALSGEELMDLLECKSTLFKGFIKECLNHGIIAKYTYYNKLCYIVNPAYAYVGSILTIDIFSLFEDDLSFLMSLGKETKKMLYKKKGINVENMISELRATGAKIYSKKIGEKIPELFYLKDE